MRPRPGTETWRSIFDNCKSGWRGFRQKERQVSPSVAPFPEGAGGGWPGHLGEGKGPRLGHAAPPPPPSLHAPTPFSSPSSCHWGPQSPGHGSTFPCKTPLFPVSSLLPPLQTPSLGPDLGLTLPLWGSRRQTPSVQPHIYQISHGSGLLPNSARDLPRFPPQSRLPLLSSPSHSQPPPRRGSRLGWAPIGSPVPSLFS